MRRPVEALARPSGRAALARGAVRLLRRVDALLAVPRSAALPGSACSRMSPSSACGVALRRAARPAVRRPRCCEVYPYLGAMLGLSLEPEAARAPGRALAGSPPVPDVRGDPRAAGASGRRTGRSSSSLEDLHWADPTSLQLLERLLARHRDGSALLLVLSPRPERDHPSWRVKESAARELPHRTREVALEALSGDADRELLHALVGAGHPPGRDGARGSSSRAEGNPFFLEELVRSLVDAGALVDEGEGWRFDHAVEVEVPPTVEKVILARIDRLAARCARGADGGLGARAAVRPAAAGGRSRRATARSGDRCRDLQRLDLVRESRRWPEPEFRFKHVLIQEAAYRTLVDRPADGAAPQGGRVARAARTRSREDEVARAARPPLAGGRGRGQGGRLPDASRATGPARSTRSTRRSTTTASCSPSSNGAASGTRSRWSCSSWPSRCTCRCGSRRRTRRTSGRSTSGRPRAAGRARRPRRSGSRRASCRTTPTRGRRSRGRTSSCACSCSTGSSRRGRSARSCRRSPSAGRSRTTACATCSTCARGCGGPTASRSPRTTSSSASSGCSNPDAPGSSVAIYFVLENGQDYYLRRNDGRRPRSASARSTTGRSSSAWSRPAPYFMSVMNRPDGGPQPRHAIERDGAAWTRPGRQVVSGAVPRSPSGPTTGSCSSAATITRARARATSRGSSSLAIGRRATRIEPYERDELDMIAVRYTPRLADLVPGRRPPTPHLGPAAWSVYLAFDHHGPGDCRTSTSAGRSPTPSTARRSTRGRCPRTWWSPRGGIVPPALQGHTPDIVPRVRPRASARACLRRSGRRGTPLADRRARDWIAPVARGRDVEWWRGRARDRESRSGRGRSSRRRRRRGSPSSRRST